MDYDRLSSRIPFLHCRTILALFPNAYTGCNPDWIWGSSYGICNLENLLLIIRLNAYKNWYFFSFLSRYMFEVVRQVYLLDSGKSLF